jgi:hypothetical protein
MGILPEQLRGHPVVRLGGFDFVLVQPQIDRLTLVTDGRQPFLVLRAPRNALEPRRASVAADVVQVLNECTHAEIALPVVPSVAADVIDDLPRWCVHDEPVHQEGFAVMVAGGVNGAMVLARGTPFVSCDLVVVGRIDDCEVSACQRDIPAPLLRRFRRHGSNNRLALGDESPAPRHGDVAEHVRQFTFMPRKRGADPLIRLSIPDGRGAGAPRTASRQDHRRVLSPKF